MVKKGQFKKTRVSDISRLIFRLRGRDFAQEIAALLRMTPESLDWAKSAVPYLLAINSNQATKAACLIGPDEEEDFLSLLDAMADVRGSMTPFLAALLERSAPQFDNQIETIAGFLHHSHYRVRIAATRALKEMGALFELIEQPLLNALKDPCPSVVEAFAGTLVANESCLTARLQGALRSTQVRPLSQEQRSIFEQLEREMAWPRMERLNCSDDEDVVFIYRYKTSVEKSMSPQELITQLLTVHGLPPHAEVFHEVDIKQFHLNLRESLKPVYCTEPCVTGPTVELAERLRSLFSKDVILLANHRYEQYDEHGHVGYGGGVTYNIVDHGVVCIDEDLIGFFFVSDED